MGLPEHLFTLTTVTNFIPLACELPFRQYLMSCKNKLVVTGLLERLPAGKITTFVFLLCQIN